MYAGDEFYDDDVTSGPVRSDPAPLIRLGSRVNAAGSKGASGLWVGTVTAVDEDTSLVFVTRDVAEVSGWVMVSNLVVLQEESAS
jgi:hypothetical protein